MTLGIVIPVHAKTQTRVKYFEECLKSLAMQKGEYVAVVVDDGSPKSEVIRGIVDRLGNANVRYVFREKGQEELHTSSNAVNYGIELLLDSSSGVLSRSELSSLASVCYLHSDDCLPNMTVSSRSVSTSTESFSYANMIVKDAELNTLMMAKPSKFSLRTGDGFTNHTLTWGIKFLKRVIEYNYNKYGYANIFDPNITCNEDRDASLSTFECAREIGVIGNNYRRMFTYIYRRQLDSITGIHGPELMKKYRDIVSEKHGLSKLHLKYYRLIQDVPWSLMTFMPEEFKSIFRPIRDYIRLSKVND